jgi:ABC-type multidrug transport system fused ATPase/permease subunit
MFQLPVNDRRHNKSLSGSLLGRASSALSTTRSERVPTDYETIVQNQKQLNYLTSDNEGAGGGGTTSGTEQLRDPTIISGVSSVGGQGPVTLTWKNLNVYVQNAVTASPRADRESPSASACVVTEKGRQIIFGLSGVARPGQLIAIMGASGAGKSTLLNSLTGRNRHGVHIEGSVLVNGHDIDRAITAVSAYVQQDDLFCGTLTVREHLYFQVFNLT